MLGDIKGISKSASSDSSVTPDTSLIQVGLYQGNGNAGPDGYNRLTFNHAPKLLILWSEGGADHCLYKWGENELYRVCGEKVGSNEAVVDGGFIGWYTTETEDAAANQFNTQGQWYYYAAIG